MSCREKVFRERAEAEHRKKKDRRIREQHYAFVSWKRNQKKVEQR